MSEVPEFQLPTNQEVGEVILRQIRDAGGDTVDIVADLNEEALRHLAAQGIKALMYQSAVAEHAQRDPVEALRLMSEFFGQPRAPSELIQRLKKLQQPER